MPVRSARAPRRAGRDRRSQLILFFLSAPLLLLLLGSCASYRAQPVDPELAYATWAAIDADSATVAIQNAITKARPGDSVSGERPFDLTDGIDLREAEITALFFNPAIRTTRLAAGVAAARARHAGLWQDPELGVDGDYILDEVDEPLVLGATLAITIPLSGRRAVAEQLQRAELDHQLAQVIGAEWALVSAVRAAWMDLAAAQARVAVLADAVERRQQLVDLGPSYRAAGAATVVDERNLLIQLRRATDTLQQARHESHHLHAQVVALMGLHPRHRWRLEASLPTVPPRPPMPNLLEHPRLRSVLAAYQVAERQVELAVREQYPDLRIGLGFGTEAGAERLLFGFGLAPLPVWNRNREQVAGMRAERSRVEAEIERALQELQQRTSELQHERSAAAERLTYLEQQLAPLIDEQVADARRLTGLGELDLFLLADAMEQSLAIRLDLLEARTNVLSSDLALAVLRGPDFLFPVPAGEAADALESDR